MQRRISATLQLFLTISLKSRGNPNLMYYKCCSFGQIEGVRWHVINLTGKIGHVTGYYNLCCSLGKDKIRKLTFILRKSFHNFSVNYKIKGVLLRKDWLIRGRPSAWVYKMTGQARDEGVSIESSKSCKMFK